MKYYIKLLSVPLLFFVLYTSLFVTWYLFDLPSTDELTTIVGSWFDKYGIPALFASSILEGILLVGSYFPGVFVIFLGVVVADSISEAIFTVFIVTLGLLIAHISNYLLGKYGWYRLLVRFGVKNAIEESKRKLERRGPIAISLSYWLPSIGALTNTAAGIIRIPFKIFIVYSIISSVFWYSLIGTIVYIMGDKALSIAVGGTGMVIVYAIVGIWMAVLLIIDYLDKKNQSKIAL